MTLILAALLLLQDPVTPDDVIRLTKAGTADAEILQKLGSARYDLSAEQIIALKKAGVSDRIVNRMIAGAKELFVKNLSHKSVRISVRGDRIDVSTTRGEELARGAGRHFRGSGTYTVTVDGRPTSGKVKTPANLTFRGCNIQDFEVLTLYIEGANGNDTVLIQMRDKTAAQAQSRPRVVYRRGLPPTSHIIRFHSVMPYRCIG